MTQLPVTRCTYPGCRLAPEIDSFQCEYHQTAGTSYYNRTVYGRQTNRVAESGDAHSLVQEISLLRVLLAELLSVTDSNSNVTILQNIPIAVTLLTSINSMVTNSAKLEVFTGRFISQEQYKALLQRILQILTEELTDLPTIQRISDRLSSLSLSDQSPYAPEDEPLAD